MNNEFRLDKSTLMGIAGKFAAMCTGDDVYSVKMSEWKDTRSLASNRKMWACLGDIAKQVQWPVNGFVQFLSAEDWKDILSASLKKEGRMAQGIDGGFVMLGQRTSKMKVKEMCDLIEIIYAFGANNGVVWSESVPDEYLEFSRMTNEKS
jgi:hypothetical protein